MLHYVDSCQMQVQEFYQSDGKLGLPQLTNPYCVGGAAEATKHPPIPKDTMDDENGTKSNPFAPECSVPLPFQLGGDEYGYYGANTVWKRNERERVRVRYVNDGYETLRQALPLSDKQRRLSKVETLCLAIRYIRHLERILQKGDQHWAECICFTEPLIANSNKQRHRYPQRNRMIERDD